jgi:hypothetical protein
MTAPQSFFRYVTGRFRGRRSAAKSAAMRTFVLTAAGGKVSKTTVWLGAVVGLLLYLFRMVKAVFDSTFEAVGFLVGHLVLRRHWLVRIIVALAAFTAVCLSLRNQPGWFIASWVALFAVSLLPALGTGMLGEPRMLTAAVKAYFLVTVTSWAWQFGYVSALLGFLLIGRAFQFLVEGMTICASELAQLRRDRRTAALFRAIRNQRRSEHPEERIILYLRPFAITGLMKVEDGRFLEAADQAAISDEHDSKTQQWRQTTVPLGSLNIDVREAVSLFEQGSELEATIEQAMSGAGHFIALGQPGEAIGAGRLPSLESEWREACQVMIEAATLCIVVPSANAGTRWEIEYLADNELLDKCCVFMPPAVGGFSYETEWRTAREALAPRLPLPEYQRNGGLFRCDGRIPTQPRTIESMPQNKAEIFALGIQWLFPELPKWRVDSSGAWFRFGFGVKVAASVRRSEGTS